ncbi:MAG: hypothetical protein FWG99_05660 [Treponema sp.]|nr:hypothetical protein [Treponema sp.]
MEITDAEKLLLGTQYEPFIGTFQRVTLKDFQYSNLYKIGNANLGYFALKVRKNNEKNVMDSINILDRIIDADNFINRNTGIIEKYGFVIIISEWLNGKQPIENRDTLPKFFSKLAMLNKNNIAKGPFTSMYLDGNYFNSTSELVDFEINTHMKYFSNSLDKKKITDVLENLKNGISCIINEDMNCGNFFITCEGEHKIVDTEWIIKSINLYQFQHIDYFGFNEKKWHTITEEAEDCYRAYFNTLGTGNSEANEQIRAIELLNVLRENTFLKFSGKEYDKEMERRIETVLGKEKYI